MEKDFLKIHFGVPEEHIKVGKKKHEVEEEKVH